MTRRLAVAALLVASSCTPAATVETTQAEANPRPYKDLPEIPHRTSIELPEQYALPARPRRPTRSRPRPTPPARPRGDEGGAGCTLDDIKRMESGGDYTAVSASGKYRGGYQFDAATFRGAATRAGHPEYAGTPVDQVPPGVQDAAARQLYSERGTQPWSVCR